MRLSNSASPTPKAAPAASRLLSTSNCRSTRKRAAPKASRMAISRSRALARASIRFTRLAQAIKSTSPVIPSSSHSDES